MPRYVVLRNEQGISSFELIEDARAMAKDVKLRNPDFQVAVQDTDSDYIEKYELRKK
jgi:hypothetical protein